MQNFVSRKVTVCLSYQKCHTTRCSSNSPNLVLNVNFAYILSRLSEIWGFCGRSLSLQPKEVLFWIQSYSTLLLYSGRWICLFSICVLKEFAGERPTFRNLLYCLIFALSWMWTLHSLNACPAWLSWTHINAEALRLVRMFPPGIHVTSLLPVWPNVSLASVTTISLIPNVYSVIRLRFGLGF